MQQFDGRASYLAQSSISDCFEKLHSKAVDFSVVPLENSTNGQVAFTYDLLRDWWLDKQGEFTVLAEQFVTIHHNFLSYASNVNEITKIYSHPQVWTQCSRYLALLKCEKIDASSTSKAAELVSSSQNRTIASILSEVASELYDIPILEKTIEDDRNNTTRFLILGYDDSSDKVLQDSVLFIGLYIRNEEFGSLCNSLNIFKRHGLNLVNITSRPSKILKWQYVFFIEATGTSKESTQECIQELKNEVVKLKVFGTFARDEVYYQNKIENYTRKN